MTNSRIIDTDQARDMLLKYVQNQPLPFTCIIRQGKDRTLEQNRLQRLWVNEIYAQLSGSYESAEHARGYCKLHFGVPIMRNEDEEFREKYDRIIRPLPYETKLELMMVPLDFPVTRIMKTKQKKAYLDAVQKHFAAQGVVLTNPDDRGL